MKEPKKLFSLIVSLVAVSVFGIWVYFNSTNYYAFFLPHAQPSKSMDAFNPRLDGSKTAEALPTKAIIFGVVVLLLAIGCLIYLRKELKRKIIRR